MLMMMMISLRTDPKASDVLERNWRCPYGHYVDAYQKKKNKQTKKTKVRNPTITVTNICERQQL